MKTNTNTVKVGEVYRSSTNPKHKLVIVCIESDKKIKVKHRGMGDGRHYVTTAKIVGIGTSWVK